MAVDGVSAWARSHPFLWGVITFVTISVTSFAVTAGLLDYPSDAAAAYALTFALVFSLLTGITNRRRS